jgi:hypothetical protein
MSEARPVVDYSVLLGDIEKSLADPLYDDHPDLVEAMRRKLAVARGEVPAVAQTEVPVAPIIEQFNAVQRMIREESQPEVQLPGGGVRRGLYHLRPWEAEERLQRARVELAKTGYSEPKPESVQDIARREIAEQLTSTQLHPTRLEMLERELFAQTEVPAGSTNLQREMMERLSTPNLSLDQILSITEHYQQETTNNLGSRAAMIEEAVKARRAELGSQYDALIADARHAPDWHNDFRGLSAETLQMLAALGREYRRINAELARVR